MLLVADLKVSSKHSFSSRPFVSEQGMTRALMAGRPALPGKQSSGACVARHHANEKWKTWHLLFVSSIIDKLSFNGQYIKFSGTNTNCLTCSGTNYPYYNSILNTCTATC